MDIFKLFKNIKLVTEMSNVTMYSDYRKEDEHDRYRKNDIGKYFF